MEQLQIDFSVRVLQPGEKPGSEFCQYFSNKLHRAIFLQRTTSEKYSKHKLEARITEDPAGLVLKEVKAPPFLLDAQKVRRR